MCGLFCLIGSEYNYDQIKSDFLKITHRGPDNTHYKQVGRKVLFGFHRLAIVGLDELSNQPMQIGGNWLICNGEIYNYKILAQKYNFNYQTHSDCEVILHMYNTFGIEQTIKELDGEFAFVIYDTSSDEIYAGRDHLGVRPLYIGKKGGDIFLASEAKSLVFCDDLEQFPPSHSWTKSKNYFSRYSSFDIAINHHLDENTACKEINRLLTRAVEKRMMADREVGCLLSGGLDSSLVAGITAKHFIQPSLLNTFSIGLKGAPDLEKAQMVADFIGSKHHNVECTEQEFLDVIEKVIYTLGSYDVTTIRASVGHYLISHWVSKHTSVKVLLSGETADEIAGGYLYFQNAPTADDFRNENIRLLNDIHFFDMKRGDRCISSAGLEGRIPFSDKDFIHYYLSIPTELKLASKGRMEKYLIRKAFANDNVIPNEILWRRKNAFSDSVSQINRSWSDIIKEHIDTKVSDHEYLSHKDEFAFHPPKTKEAYYYRTIFTKYYGKHQNLTPYQWLPKWSGDILDPSARKLSIYDAD